MDTVVRSIQRGLNPLGARALANGIADFDADLSREWPSLVADDLVGTATLESSHDEAFSAVAGRFAGWTERQRQAATGESVDASASANRLSVYARSLIDDELSDLEAMLATDGVAYLLTLLAAQDDAYLSALLEVYHHAAVNRLTTLDYVRRLHRTAERFGASRDVIGDLYRTWLALAVEEPLTQTAGHAANTTRAGQLAFPYLQQVTAADERVRVNHAALHGFTAQSTWEGWVLETLAPLGWGCRCRPRRVSRQEARERRLIDVMDEASAIMLARFRSLGGADADFPRQRFVIQPA